MPFAVLQSLVCYLWPVFSALSAQQPLCTFLSGCLGSINSQFLGQSNSLSISSLRINKKQQGKWRCNQSSKKEEGLKIFRNVSQMNLKYF